MTWRYKYILKPSFTIIDLIAITVAFFAAHFIRFPARDPSGLKGLLFSLLLWTLLSVFFKLSHVSREYKPVRFDFSFFFAQIIFVSLLSISIIFGDADRISRLFFGYFLVFQATFLIVVRYLRRHYVKYLRSSGRNLNWIYLIGSESDRSTLDAWLKKTPYSGYRKKETYFFQSNPSSAIEDCLKWLEDNFHQTSGEDLLINPVSWHHESDFDKVIYLAEDLGARVFLMHPLQHGHGFRTAHHTVGPFGVLLVREEPLLRPWAMILKRAVDVIISSLAVVFILSWVSILCGIAIKLTSQGPIFFIQERIGRNRKPFACIKFRTMSHSGDSDEQEDMITRVNDARITPVGKFLRKTNLDEFPQFINVLMGHMSVVGPRPHMVVEDNNMELYIPRYRLRQRVRPGITGWAAVNGYRGGTDRIKLMKKRIEYDHWYIENWSLSLELKIVFMTAFQMLTLRTGAH